MNFLATLKNTSKIFITSALFAVGPIVASDQKIATQQELLNASENGNLDEVEKIVSLGEVDINCIHPTFLRRFLRQTPLILAAMKGHKEVVRYLLTQRGIKINQADCFNRTALHFAAACNRVGIVRLLLKHPDIEINGQNNNGLTPLSYAAYNGYTDIVDLLLSQPGIETNPTDSFGNSPLILAVQRGFEAIVQLLLNMPQIDINHTNGEGKSARDFAEENNFPHIMHLLDEASQLRASLSAAVAEGHIERVKEIITLHPRLVNYQVPQDDLARQVAEFNAGLRTEICMWVNEKGLSGQSTEMRGKPILQIAIETGQKELIEFLMKQPEIDLSFKAGVG